MAALVAQKRFGAVLATKGWRRRGEGAGTTRHTCRSLPPSIQELVSLASSSDRGENLTSSSRSQVEDICNAVESENRSRDSSVGGKELSKTWKLLFTTEKETLFITSNAKKYFGLETEVSQIIDLESGKLQNLIAFDNGAAFVVDSSIELEESSCRSNFSFVSAKFILPSGSVIGLPPFGRGWFDTLYVDGQYRLARDSRGDILLVQNAGEPEFKE
mmetsp:Transcript_6988/g.12828  ORF Transcript_6988/g.12828 Transcript_6988/m.12828 type:complete len:216 (-) Transcript_6988:2871-3518(-)